MIKRWQTVSFHKETKPEGPPIDGYYPIGPWEPTGAYVDGGTAMILWKRPLDCIPAINLDNAQWHINRWYIRQWVVSTVTPTDPPPEDWEVGCGSNGVEWKQSPYDGLYWVRHLQWKGRKM